MVDLTKLERFHLQIVENDNELLDQATALCMLDYSEWVPPASFEGLAIILALSDPTSYIAITLINNKYPQAKLQMYMVPGRTLENLRPAPWTFIIHTPECLRPIRTTASTMSRAGLLALLELEIELERERQEHEQT